MSDKDQTPRVWWSKLVRDADQIVGPARAVCWFLADVADKNGASWYGQKKIALHAGVTDRTVRNVLDDLVSKGVIRLDPPAEGHRCPTTTLIAAGLKRWKGIPIRAESGSTKRGKGFHPKRKRIPTNVETLSDEVSKKSPEEDPIEDPNEEHTVDDEPPSERDHMPTDHRGSRPTMDSDPIDNDGEDTSPLVAPPPSSLTDPERPATSETSASTDPASWSLPPIGDASPPAKPKRKAKTATALDLEAWGRCCQAWDGMTGRTRAWRPEAGDGKTIAAAMLEQGTAKVAARFDQAARDAWCCGAARDSSRPLSVSALTRAETALTSRLDAAAEQATLDAESRSEAVAASGGMLTHPSAQNAPERQPAPKQTVAWADVLRDLGSDPQTHPEDGPHRKHWPRVREAIYSATKSSGDAWKTWCLADETKRQRVERVLSLVTA